MITVTLTVMIMRTSITTLIIGMISGADLRI